jgi:hypothetical protein
MPPIEVVEYEVERYAINLHRPFEEDAATWIAQITCYGDPGEPHKTLRIRFQPTGEPIAENTYDPDTGHAFMFRPASEYPWYIDLLRNEAPVFATIIPSDPALNQVSTLLEPVGEGELGRAS